MIGFRWFQAFWQFDDVRWELQSFLVHGRAGLSREKLRSAKDMLIGLADDPPEILTKSPYKEGLLYFARNEPLEKAGQIWDIPSRYSQDFQVDVESFQVIKDGYQKLLVFKSYSCTLQGIEQCSFPRSTLLLNNINPRSLLSVAAGTLGLLHHLSLSDSAALQVT